MLLEVGDVLESEPQARRVKAYDAELKSLENEDQCSLRGQHTVVEKSTANP
jgi:hypothetical protein